MDCVNAEGAAECVFIARRNNSLSSSGRLLFFSFILAVSLGIALGFALILGAWPILPFAGLEMAVLYVALRYIDRHAHDYEMVAIDGNRLRIELAEGADVRRYDFNRHWTTVECVGDNRLTLKSHGRQIEIGRHLPEERRMVMARDLTRRLRTTGWQAGSHRDVSI
jgi:uncharacterized membrane protein